MKETVQTQKNDATGVVGASTNGTKRKRVLLVESDGMTRLILLHLLRTVGLDVDFASNGSIALNRLRQNPDAILMELNLLGIKGTEFIREARRDPNFANRPIYVFTCMDFMSRASRKVATGEATRVFDKLSILPEKVVTQIAADLMGVKLSEEQHEAISSDKKGFETSLKTRGKLQETIAEIQQQSLVLAQSSKPEQWLANCAELRTKVYGLMSFAAVARMSNLARQAQILEAYLSQLNNEPKQLKNSCLETVSNAVGMLELIAQGDAAESGDMSEFTAVVVDQSPASCTAINDALLDAGFKPASFGEPSEAMKHLASNRTQLIILNVRVPELHGLESTKIRGLSLHKATPVIHVPSPADLHHPPDALPISAARMDVNPIALTELVLKSLSVVQKITSTGQPSKSKPAGQKSAPPKPSAESQPGEPAVSNEDRKKVLFIEDDPVMIKLYKTRLEREGFQIQNAEDGMIALDMLPTIRPDVVVLDLMLPKLHGLEVLKFIRSDVNLKATPVIVLSNVYMEGMAAKAIKAGANMGMLKTQCTPNKLILAIQDVLRGVPAGELEQTPTQKTEPPPATGDVASPEDTAHRRARTDLLKDAPQLIAQIRQDCLNYVRTAGSEAGQESLNGLYRGVRFLGARAGLSGFADAAAAASALEALLFEIAFNYSPATPSALQTIAQAVDCLGRMFLNPKSLRSEPRQKPRILVVDDDSVFNAATVAALKRANFDAFGVQDPRFGLSMMQSSRFDIVLLDINMPELSGFQVCEELRRIPGYKTTPVIFVTISGEFQNRARGILAGGNDLITKPISLLELTLKLTMLLLDSREHSKSAATADASAPAEASESQISITDQSQVQESAVTAEESSSRTDLHADIVPDQEIQPRVPIEASTDADSELPESNRITAAETEAQLTVEEPADAITDENIQPTEATDAGIAGAAVNLGAEGDLSFAEIPDLFKKAPAQPESSTNGGRQDYVSFPGATQPAGESPVEEPHSVEETQFAESGATTENGEAQEQLPPLDTQPASPQADLDKYQKERDELVARLYDAEVQLDHTRSRVVRRDEAIKQLQKQLEDLTTAKLELEKQLADKPQAAAQQNGLSPEELSNRIKELETELGQSRSELEQAKADFAKQSEERRRLEEDLRQQLAAAAAAAQRIEAAQKEAQDRCHRLEQDLAGLRQAREELSGKFEQEHKAAADSGKRIQELESQLGQNASALEQVKAELAKQSGERGQTEADLRQQLTAATTAAQQAEAAQKEAQQRCRQLEQDLATLRQSREELSGKVAQEHQAAADSGKRIKELENELGHKRSELERAKEEMAQRAQEREQLENNLRKQLAAATTAAQQAEAAQKETQERCAQLGQALESLRQASEELNTKFFRAQRTSADASKRINELEQRLSQNAAEAERAKTELEKTLGQRGSELEGAKAELEKQSEERKRLESELQKQVAAAAEAARQAETSQKQSQERCRALEQELGELRQAREELTGKFTQEHRVAAESGKRIKELESELSHSKTALERSKAKLTKQTAAAATAAEQAAASQKEMQGRCQQLEQDLAGLRQAREDLSGKYAKEHQVAAESGKRVKELENELGQSKSELQRVSAELAKQTAAAQHAEAANKQSQERGSQLEQDLAALRQAREELSGKLTHEHQAATEAGKRVRELENELGQSKSALEQAKTELAKQTKSASTAAQQAESAQKQLHDRCGQLERSLAEQRQAREELSTKSAQEHQAATEAAKRVKDLEKMLNQSVSELERAKADLTKQATAASTAVQQAEALQKQNAQLEQDLASLLQSREELTAKYAQEHQVASASGKRLKDLELELKHSTSELERTKAELAKQTAAVAAAAQHAEVTHKQNQERFQQLEQDLAALRHVREELAGKFAREQQLASESGKRIQRLEKDLDRTAAELGQAQAEVEKQSTERRQLESELHKQAETAAAAAQQAQAAQKQSQERCRHLEQDLAALRQAREELTGKFAREQQLVSDSQKRIQELEQNLDRTAAELAQAQGEVAKRTGECSRLEAEMRKQAETAAAATQQTESAYKQSQERCRQLEHDLAALEEVREELKGKWAKEQQVVAEANGRIGELEKQLLENEANYRADISKVEHSIRQGVETLGRVTADLDKERGDRQRIEQRAATLASRLQELHDELSRHLDAGRARDRKIVNLEEQLLRQTDTVARLTSDLKHESTDRQLAEERCRAAETLNAELKEDLSFFEKAKQVFKGTEAELASRLEVSLGTLRQSESKWQAESGERQRLGKALQEAQTLVRDKQQAIEKQELELQTTVKALNETQSKFQKEASERQHLAEALNAARRNLDDQAQRSEKLESQLRTVLEALTETKSVLQSESSERQRLAEALEAAHREQREQSQRSEIEVSKLRSQIHLEGVERKRLEADVAQLRHQATDSERAGRILQSTLRKQIRKPVDDVYQSARCLLQLELPEEQKKLVEVVLKDALLVQTCLQEDEPLFNGSNS